MATTITHADLRVNGVRLHVAQAGSANGKPVILLHGFPEYWGGWKHQIPALAAAGYRVWAPDQRGYNLSDKPVGIDAYVLDELAADVAGLIQAMGVEKVFLVGHDWGAAVAWWTALHYPHLLQKLVILNVPHPIVMRRTLSGNWRQTLKSWYMFFFQIPWLPETLMTVNNASGATQMMAGSSKPTTFSDEEMADYRKAWLQPGAFTGMINWYRALMRRQPQSPPSYRVSVPTLMIWGKNDIALSSEMAQPSIDLCDNGRLVFLENATHWVQHDEPEEVNRLLLEFLV